MSSRPKVQNANLSGVSFENCRFSGATINGISIQEMLDLYRKTQKG